MFKLNNKDTRTTPMTCSSASIVTFEQVNAGWVIDAGPPVLTIHMFGEHSQKRLNSEILECNLKVGVSLRNRIRSIYSRVVSHHIVKLMVKLERRYKKLLQTAFSVNVFPKYLIESHLIQKSLNFSVFCMWKTNVIHGIGDLVKMDIQIELNVHNGSFI